jgi:FxLD family lantipeptide
MPPTVVFDRPVDDVESVADEEFDLDLRVVEATTPMIVVMCSTNDGCGSTCSTSACASRSDDPA